MTEAKLANSDVKPEDVEIVAAGRRATKLTRIADAVDEAGPHVTAAVAAALRAVDVALSIIKEVKKP